jgi:hypothetical protein
VRTKKSNLKLFLMLLMTMVLLASPILVVEASVKGNSDKLEIDLSNGIIKNGYFSLPIEEDTLGEMFRIAYYPGYIDEVNNKFIALGVRVLEHSDWVVNKTVNVPLSTKLIKFNNEYVFSFRDEYDYNKYRIPVELNGKRITIEVLFDGALGKVIDVSDNEGNEASLKIGDIIKPIFKYYTENHKMEEIVIEDKQIVYDNSLRINQSLYASDKYAFKIYTQSTGRDGHAYSDTIVPATFTAATNTNNMPTPSAWAKADIDKAKANGLTTERVLKDYQKAITREEFCELTVNLYEKLSGKTAEPAASNSFVDTDNIAVLKAYKLGIVNGTGNGEFSPDKLLNREQMAKMFFSTLQLEYKNIGDAEEELSFTDKDKISIWAKQAVNYMFKEKIILGSNNQFNPQQEASREQAIALVYRVFEKFKN